MFHALEIAEDHRDRNRRGRPGTPVTVGERDVYDITNPHDLAEYHLVLSYTRTA
ncbi:hypothetical protein [Catenuloplanes indicus]|uniref:Uncharacterized protein n=1 Tax=Catenuloplanes indicus TaxID=137267 RepID=A0AAE3VZK4_9ACTN|nr:hypothetical protein [Catenuloplanes indicus]MDQ0366878.1 hypothetical protein [Catenuloplanes indicus]